MCVCTDHAAALLAAVQPGCSAPVQRTSALVQALTARPVVTTGTAEQIFIWVSAVAGSPPAVRLSILHNRRKEEIDFKQDCSRNAVQLLSVFATWSGSPDEPFRNPLDFFHVSIW